MTAVLNLLYSLGVLLVAAAGIAYVLRFTGTAEDEDEDGFDWLTTVAVVVLVLFLVVMVADLLGVDVAGGVLAAWHPA